MANVHILHPDPIHKLAREIRDLITSGDRATAQAEQFYKDAGERLIELKESKPDGVTWEVYVKEQCGISDRRARELMSIADGRATLEQLRTRAREGMQKVREDRRNVTPRSGPTQKQIAEIVASLDPNEKTIEEETWDEIAKPEDDESESDPESGHAMFMLRVGLGTQAVRGCDYVTDKYLKSFSLHKRKDMAKAARAVAEAWSALALTLEKSL